MYGNTKIEQTREGKRAQLEFTALHRGSSAILVTCLRQLSLCLLVLSFASVCLLLTPFASLPFLALLVASLCVALPPFASLCCLCLLRLPSSPLASVASLCLPLQLFAFLRFPSLSFAFPGENQRRPDRDPRGPKGIRSRRSGVGAQECLVIGALDCMRNGPNARIVAMICALVASFIALCLQALQGMRERLHRVSPCWHIYVLWTRRLCKPTPLKPLLD